MPAAISVSPSPESMPALRRCAFQALGTRCEIQYGCETDAQAREFERAAVGWVQAFEAKFSRFRPDSMLSQINAAAGERWIAVDQEMEQMLDICAMLHRLTQGVLDATALPLLRLWNYKAERPALPDAAEVAQAKKLVGWSKVQRQPGKVSLPERGMALDFGGFGKEYAVDMVAEIAKAHGLSSALIDFGHDLRAVGRPVDRAAWHIGLENPGRPGTHDGSIGVVDRGVASSGDYLRGFTVDGVRYGHIIDVRSGRPVANGCLQATVVARTCLEAGVLSTTAFVLGTHAGLAFVQAIPGAEALLRTAHERAQTRGFFHYVVT